MKVRLLAMFGAISLVVSFFPVIQNFSGFESIANAQGYNCGSPATGTVSCSSYLGTIRCNFYSAMPDSTQQRMTIDQVNLAKSSNLSVQMNLPKNIMKISISHEAKNAADLQYYLQNISKIESQSNIHTVSKTDKSLNGFDAQQLLGGQYYYAYEVTPHKFYRIIDKAKFNAFLKKTQSTFAMAKAMLIDMPYKVVLNFAKPVKKLYNSKAVLSADHKHVILQTNMEEIIKNPSVMNLKIDF